MTIVTDISPLSADNVGNDVLEKLAEVFPEGVERRWFHCRLPSEDERMKSVLRCLHNAGIYQWTDKSRSRDVRHEYRMHFDREYDKADLDACDYLELRPEACDYGAISRTDNGTMIVPEQQMPEGSFDFLFGHIYYFFVPTRVKTLLQSANLVGVRFRSTFYIPLDATASDTDETIRSRHGTPYWELDSGLGMPPLAPSVSLIDRNEQPVPHGFLGPCRPRDGLFLHPELHYRASELASLPPFDLARTYEQFTFGPPGDRPIIASKRFYRFCVEHGLKTGWVPVRVDSD